MTTSGPVKCSGAGSSTPLESFGACASLKGTGTVVVSPRASPAMTSFCSQSSNQVPSSIVSGELPSSSARASSSARLTVMNGSITSDRRSVPKVVLNARGCSRCRAYGPSEPPRLRVTSTISASSSQPSCSARATSVSTSSTSVAPKPHHTKMAILRPSSGRNRS